MKLSTLIKLTALGAAAVSTAAGSALLTTKAVKKLGNETFPDDPTQKGIDVTKAPAPVSEPVITPVAPVAPAAPVYVAPEPEPMPAAPVYVAPEPEPIPAAPAFVAPEPEPIPVVPVAPTPIPVVEPEGYTDVPMDLPYLAGKLDSTNEDAAEVVVTPVEKATAPVEPVVPVVEEPVVPMEPVAPVVEPIAPVAPVVDIPVAPIAPVVEAPVAPVEPEIILPTAEPIAEPTTTFADITPEPVVLPTAAETVAPDFSNVELPTPEPAPVTFNELNSEYVEEVQPVVTEIVEPAASVVTEEVAPVVEEAPATSVVEVSVAPEVTEKGRTVQIGGAIISDRSTNDAIVAVVNAFGIPAENLVSIAAEGNPTMVFEFLYSDMRTDATLMNVYFILPTGEATLSPETDRENVLASGRNFITGNEELREFLA